MTINHGFTIRQSGDTWIVDGKHRKAVFIARPVPGDTMSPHERALEYMNATNAYYAAKRRNEP